MTREIRYINWSDGYFTIVSREKNNDGKLSDYVATETMTADEAKEFKQYLDSQKP